ncbi:hypothetical protein [Actinomadura rupiterrae]|uniref:hypothetical protein n=1 Tax=Actinomadura rupiterrae TaxID=559627 RepID=UPI0020A34B01|nr:hypothetical protein [Actinomadura rupiterrae]MCP2338977.1 hypothetical protein [Actinomadura rupiterrae]
MASLYAELAHRRGWLRPDRTLAAGQFADLRESVAGWAAQDHTWQDVTDTFGEPSVLFGPTSPLYGKTLGYVSEDPAEPMIFFHLWDGIDTEAKAGDRAARDGLMLGAVRFGDAVLDEALLYTPQGQRLREASDVPSVWD